MELTKIKEYIESVRWKTAKTEKFPHAYTIKEWAPEKNKTFEEFVIFIREHGYDKNFFRVVYKYFDIDGYQYWTMGVPLNETILINRAKI